MSLRLDRSRALFERAQQLLPGGVSSPVRAFKAVGGTPVFMRRGQGATVVDEDGNRYIDWCMSWGPLALGHAHPAVVRAVRETAEEGTSFGTPTLAELKLAEAVTRLQPLAEKVRFTSSGTEAVMSAVRAARGFTGRDLVVKFDGCYHGHVDYLLVKAGSGLATAGQPDSGGVPAAIAGTTVVLPLDDEATFMELMATRGRDVAVVVIEPVPANSGLLVQRRRFLQRLRTETELYGALLLFDEVISGFRLGPRGAAGLYGIRPDLLTFGKVIGGGLPVGAYAGRQAVMDVVAPVGPVYQAGTLSGNPVAMAAGRAALEALEQGGWAKLRERSRAADRALRAAIGSYPVKLVRAGSIFWLHFQEERPRAWHRVRTEGAERYRRLHRALLERGVYFAPSAFEVFFCSTAHDDEAIARTAEALEGALKVAFDEAAQPRSTETPSPPPPRPRAPGEPGGGP